MRRELLFASRDDALFTNNKGYIFIVRRLGKQSKLILSRLDSISNLKLNLRIHGQCGPDAHAGADLQAFLIFRFKPILISAHKLTLLIYGDNNAVLLVVAAASLLLGSVPLAMAVVDAGSKITAVEAGAKIQLVDLLVPAMGAYRAVGAGLRPVVGVLLHQVLSLGCCNV